MKHWGILKRVMFAALAPAAVIALLLVAFFGYRGVHDLDESLRNRGLAIARQLAPASEFGVFSGNQSILQRLAEATLHEKDVAAVTITAADGSVLAEAGKSVAPPVLTDFEAGRFVAMGESGELLNFSAPVIQSQIELDDFAAPARRDSATQRGRVLGRINVVISRADTRRHQRFLVLESLLIALLGLAGSALLAWRMSRSVTLPVRHLASVVERFGRGQLDLRADESSGGELLTLERGINKMAAALLASQERMQERIDAATERLSYQATHDALTGLVNRREFERRLEKALMSAHREGLEHALCYLDLDQFKIVNDSCGHVAGDELLTQLTVLLESKVRDSDVLARLGGDEFGVLLENCSLEKAEFVADLLRQTVKDFHFVWQGKPFAIGVSIGLVPISTSSESLSALLSAADSACYAAKDKGRNRVHVFLADDKDLAQRQGEMNWVTRITHAIEENRFQLFCQRIQPLKDSGQQGLHLEIFLRMLDDHGELIPPMAFIPAAERFNLMPAVDRWVVSRAFGQYWNVSSRDESRARHLFYHQSVRPIAVRRIVSGVCLAPVRTV
jgi:diguanylate cyclase (GGDEF)-like protein